ncbi:molybdopterin-dependent oxidoreductase [Nocardia sp. NBC_01377]|uniref:molybdopterin-dependent oxidoreductase n=1 Tax=Nocardia sp. NBC_01377 TaxID=2903595 RepID=UPI0032547ECB
MRTSKDRKRVGGLGAAAVGLAALGSGEVVAAVGGASLIDAIGRTLTDTAPLRVVETTVEFTGRHDKTVIRFGTVAGALAGAVGLAGLPARWHTPAATAFGAGAGALGLRQANRSAWISAGAAAAAGVLGAGLRSRSRGPLATLAVGAAGAGMLAAAHNLNRDHDRKQRSAIRRLGAMGNPAVTPEDGLEGEPGLSALITPEHKFYVVDVSPHPPRVDPARWRLAVTGMVAHPLRLSLADLAADAVEFDAVLVCVHNRPGQGRVANARWVGVPLADLLRHVIPASGATRLVTRAVDGYTISLPVEPLRSGELPGYLVIGMNGEPLSPAHGFPARVVVPGLYGQYTGAKWLAELELTDDSHVDYWWKRGWTSEPLWVEPQARIDVAAPGRESAGTTVVAGVAWAPPAGVAEVEVSVGGGAWQTTKLADELAPAAWRRWRTTLELPAGRHTIRARVVGRSGVVQAGENRPPYPSGPGGFHAVTVEI